MIQTFNFRKFANSVLNPPALNFKEIKLKKQKNEQVKIKE